MTKGEREREREKEKNQKLTYKIKERVHDA